MARRHQKDKHVHEQYLKINVGEWLCNNDWFGCSYSARGAFSVLLCYAVQLDEPGIFRDEDGRPWPLTRICSLFRLRSMKQSYRLLRELMRNGFVRQHPDGTYYTRWIPDGRSVTGEFQKLDDGSVASIPHWRRRLIREQSNGGSISKVNRLHVLASGKCAECGATSSLTVDHIIPVKFGGGPELENLQCLCRRCNSRKSAKVLVTA